MSLFPDLRIAHPGTLDSSGAAEVSSAHQPLAERMRPRTLDEFIGQEKLLGPGKSLRVQIENDSVSSMLFWGPPGCGKTTLARVIARLTRSEFISFSAVLSGIKEIKEVMAQAERKSHSSQRTIVFVDEVHRFNKAQQDAFLPYVEAGHILFIGATTENPSFEVIAPLLSRTKVYVLEALTTPQIVELLRRALEDNERGLGGERIALEDVGARKEGRSCDSEPQNRRPSTQDDSLGKNQGTRAPLPVPPAEAQDPGPEGVNGPLAGLKPDTYNGEMLGALQRLRTGMRARLITFWSCVRGARSRMAPG